MAEGRKNYFIVSIKMEIGIIPPPIYVSYLDSICRCTFVASLGSSSVKINTSDFVLWMHTSNF